MALDNALVIAAGKGGVGKTTLAANIAGLAASSAGARVLVVDLDQQANLRRDLGTDYDDGEELFDALRKGTALPITRDVRPNLDMVPGGPALGDLAAISYAQQRGSGPDLADKLTAGLARVAGDYDLIVIDTPPGERVLVEAAMIAARFLLIPTRPDEGSLDGLAGSYARYSAAVTRNPDLTLLGVVIFGLDSRAKTVDRKTREAVAAMLGGSAPIIKTTIRHQIAAAVDARKQGLLIHELESGTAEANRRRLRWLRDGQPSAGEGEREVMDLRTRDAKGLTDDFWAVTQEVLTAMESELIGSAGGLA